MEKGLKKKDAFRIRAKAAAALADKKKGLNIIVMDLRKLPAFTSYLMICTGRSEPHIRAITDEIYIEFKKKGLLPLNVEGRRANRWILMDYGGLVINIMHPELRILYSLEKLWTEARRVVWKKRKKR